MRGIRRIVTVVVCLGASCSAQSSDQTTKLISTGGCPSGINFQQDGYRVQSSRVDDPFDFLRWIGRKQHRVSEKISALVDGKPFQYDSAVSGALKIIE